MSSIQILLAILIGLAVNEFCDVSPWAARKLVRWSAYRRYTDPTRAGVRADELAALINDRPGNLFKLLTALSFVAGATATAGRRAIERSLARFGRRATAATEPLEPLLTTRSVLPPWDDDRVWERDSCGRPDLHYPKPMARDAPPLTDNLDSD